MEAKSLDRIYSAEQAKSFASKVKFNQGETITYILAHRLKDEFTPLYVGTAKQKSRIDNHARKAFGNTNLTRRSKHILFAEYIEEQSKKYGPEWIGFCLSVHKTRDKAESKERELIQKYGIQKKGGKLFNRRMGG